MGDRRALTSADEFLLYYHIHFGLFYIVVFSIFETFQNLKITLILKKCCDSFFFPSPLQMLQAGFSLSCEACCSEDFFDNADALDSTPKV